MSSTANNPRELYFDQLREIHSVEIQLCEAMPHLVSMCTNEELRDLLTNHARENCNQIAELGDILERHDEMPARDKCRAMAELLREGASRLESIRSPHTRDLMMLAHCLKIEHFEMADYELTSLLSGRLGLVREPEILSELFADEMEMAAALMELEPDIFSIANSIP
jgi:ferritin-like metal-binding protein YciE